MLSHYLLFLQGGWLFHLNHCWGSVYVERSNHWLTWSDSRLYPWVENGYSERKTIPFLFFSLKKSSSSYDFFIFWTNEYPDGNLFPKGKQVLINKCKEDEHSSDRLKREQKISTRNFASSTEIWLPSYNFSETMYELGSKKC